MKRGSGWRVILPYALVCASTQVLWLTYAVITTESARHYGVSSSAIGWLAEIFPLLYVVLAIPAGILLDRWFRPVLAGGGALVAAGGLLRLGGDTFAWAMAGQVTVAVAQPVVLSAVSKLAGEYLPVDQEGGRHLGRFGWGLCGDGACLDLADSTVGGHGELQRLLEVEAVLAVVPALMMIYALRRPGQEGEDEHAAIEGQCGARAVGIAHDAHLVRARLRGLWRVRGDRDLAADLVGTVGRLRNHSGSAACRHGGRVGVIRLRSSCNPRGGLARGGAQVLALRGIGQRRRLHSFGGDALDRRSRGGDCGDGLDTAAGPASDLDRDRASGRSRGGHRGVAIVWMAGNLGGLVVALIVQALVHHPLAAFIAMAVVSFMGLPLVARVITIQPVSDEEPALRTRTSISV